MKTSLHSLVLGALLLLLNLGLNISNAADPQVVATNPIPRIYFPNNLGSWQTERASTNAPGIWTAFGDPSAPDDEFISLVPSNLASNVFRFRNVTNGVLSTPFVVQFAGRIEAVVGTNGTTAVETNGTGRARLYYPDNTGGWRLSQKEDGTDWEFVEGTSTPGDEYVTIPPLGERSRTYRFRKWQSPILHVSEEFRVAAKLSVPTKLTVQGNTVWRVGIIGADIGSGYFVQRRPNVASGTWTIEYPVTGPSSGFYTIPDITAGRMFYRLIHQSEL